MRQPSAYLYDASDPFGSLAGGRKYPHTGSDWLAPLNSEAYSITSGATVTATGWHNGNGNYVAIRLPDGSYWSYIHLNKILVDVGQSLREGDVVGLTGNTGSNSRGPHLHCSHSDSPKVYVGLGHLTDPHQYLLDHPEPHPTPTDIDEDKMTVVVANNEKPGIFAVIVDGKWKDLATGSVGGAQLRAYDKITAAENNGPKREWVSLSGEEWDATRGHYLSK